MNKDKKCPSGVTCLPTDTDCCFSELTLQKFNLACWSSTKRTSTSHQYVTCSCHDMAEKLLTWR